MGYTSDDPAGGPKGPSVCVACGRPKDDIETMTQPELLEAIHLGVLRDLARVLRSGEATHQELAVARGILRDNKKLVPLEDGPEDAAMPQAGVMPVPPRKFNPYPVDE